MDLLADDVQAGDPAASLALEEALVRAAPPAPLLRIWRTGAAVVIGRGQQAAREADLPACAAAGVPVLRRASGGGAVFSDLGGLNLTLVVPGWVPGLPGELASLVAGMLRRLGLSASVTNRGVLVGGAKVSGLASQLTRAGTLAHATLLVTTPADRVWSFLTPAPPDPRPLDSLRSPVCPLADLADGIGVPAACARLLAEAALRYGGLLPRPARDAELRWQERLLAQRYRTDSWHLAGGQPARALREAQWTTRHAASFTG
jgi:lipoate-protein ligase A